jgi:heme exporter protein B
MLISAILNIVNYDIKLYARKGGEMMTVLSFFLIATTTFPLALGANTLAIKDFAPAFIWIIALLASLLSIPSIFHRDYSDGTLDQIRLSAIALEWCVFAKCIANWIGCQLPLIVLAPLCGLMLGMAEEQTARMALSLMVATPILCCIGALGSALTLSAAGKNNILAVIVLPLYIPTLIFGTNLAASASDKSVFLTIELPVLTGMALGMLPLCCWASAAIIKIQD